MFTPTMAHSRLSEDIIWTRKEKVLFWEVIKNHISTLNSDPSLILQDPSTLDIDFKALDSTSLKDFCHCRSMVRTCLWRGEYRKAVFYYQLMLELFYTSFGGDIERIGEMEFLETIFLNSSI